MPPTNVYTVSQVSAYIKSLFAEDLLMGAPSPAEPRALRELHMRVVEPQAKPAGGA
jgi:aspartyl-tRNA synthetase